MKIKTIIILLTLALFLQSGYTLSAAPLFPDVTKDHWAKDAVADLASKGILEGYPDGTFKGDRSSSRWEMALMLQRTYAKMEAEHVKFASKADLEALKALTIQLKDELDALGIRVKNLEENVDGLDKRVQELERIRFYGHFHTILTGADIRGSLPNAGSREVPVADWSTGRILQNGSGFTSLAKLGTIVDMNKDLSFGLEITGYHSSGDQLIDQYWGVSAPYLSNPFTAQGTDRPGLQPLSNSPWNRVTLDRFWLQYKPLETKLVVGSFNPEIIDRNVLYGMRNPNINAPTVLPLYGINVQGKMGINSPLKYEVLYSRLPQASVYQTQTAAASIKYAFNKGSVKLNYLYAGNSEFGDGVNQGPRGVVLPEYPDSPGSPVIYWRTRAGSTSNNRIGPQDMNIIGLSVDYDFSKYWKGFVKFSSSHYNPDTTGRLYNDTASGVLINLGVKAEFNKARGSVQYLSVDSAYDPFMLQYPRPEQGILVFLPYSTYYFNYYQLHDYIKYPSNRQGFRAELEYDFSKKTTAGISYNHLEQVKASTPEEFARVGNIEPIFPCLQQGGSQKGFVRDFGLSLKHDIGKLKGFANYTYTQERRDAGIFDSVDVAENIYRLNLEYPVTNKLDVIFNYYFVDYHGHTGIANAGFTQHIPSLSAALQLSKDSSLGATYRYLTYKNTEINNNDWHAGQVMMEYKLKF